MSRANSGSVEPPVYGDYARGEVVPFIPDSATHVLDVGCGGGAFGALLKRVRKSVTVCGIEPNLDRARLAQSRLDEVICGYFPDDLPRRRFDVVIFNDVLEHLPDPWSTLRSARDYLDSNGTVIASIPNVRSVDVIADLLIRREWMYGDEGVMDRTHLRFFTRRSATRLFAEAGYTVLRCEGVNRDTSSRKIGRLLGFLRIPTELRYLQYVFVATPSGSS